MSITKSGNSPDSNGHSNGHSNGAMQYYQAGATGGTPYGYYYDMAQAYQPGDAAMPTSPNGGGGYTQGESQDARTQNGFPTSPVYMQRFPSFQQGQEYQNFGGDRQPVYGNAQSFQYAQGGVYQDPNQFMGATLGPQSNPLGSSSNADVIARGNMMGAAISVAQTMPMLAAGVYQMGVNRGAVPVVSVNDQTFAQMAPRGGGGMSWADIAKVASDNQASVNGTMPPLSPVMQPKVLSPVQPFALAPTSVPPMFALNGQQRFIPGPLPIYGRGYPPPYQLLTISSQAFPGRGGRGFKGFATNGRGRGFGFPARGGFDSALTQRYESGNERGPRAQRIRFGQPGAGEEDLALPGGREQFNREDFDVTPQAAKFFVIKSYSEDDVHKSIKYGVWASTPNGNKRLQAAFREAQEEDEAGRVFLLFSVNASGQFCGVAEMIGDVDFDKSLDVWQQDKWNGQFKVQWHFVKDVPNGQFRHIILANNENKPVTNSRDTQEVPYDQGLEVLSIFKSFAAKTSILDDFAFYDNRQKQLQERREKTKQSRSQRRQKVAAESRGDDDEHDDRQMTDPTNPAAEPVAEEGPRPAEEESIEEQLASLTVSNGPQDETEH